MLLTERRSRRRGGSARDRAPDRELWLFMGSAGRWYRLVPTEVGMLFQPGPDYAVSLPGV